MYPLRLLVLVVALLSACVHQTALRTHDGYEHVLKERHRIALLPAKAEVYMVGVHSQTRMYDYESALEDIINAQIPSLIRAKGYDVTLFKKADIYRAGFSSQVLDLRQKYGVLAKKIQLGSLMPRERALKITESLSDETKKIGEATDNDLLMLVDYHGSVQTNGARAMGVAMDMLIGTHKSASVDASTMIISIMDAKSGDLLWSNTGVDNKGIYGSAFERVSSGQDVDIKRVQALGSSALLLLPDKSALTEAEKK